MNRSGTLSHAHLCMDLRIAGPPAALSLRRLKFQSNKHYDEITMTGRCRSSSFEKDVGIECMEGLRPEVDHAVDRGIDNCLTYTDLGVGKKYEVR
jgi:hypothetical protein